MTKLFTFLLSVTALVSVACDGASDVGDGGQGDTGGSLQTGGTAGDAGGSGGGSSAYVLPPHVTSYEIRKVVTDLDGSHPRDESCPNKLGSPATGLGACLVTLTYSCTTPTENQGCAVLGYPSAAGSSYTSDVYGTCNKLGVVEDGGTVGGDVCCPGCWDGKVCHILPNGSGGATPAACAAFKPM